MTVYTFEKACEVLGKRDTKKIDNNTFLVRGHDWIDVQLHGTTIVRICRDGTYTLFSGGYHTVTTKRRINAYAPAGVSQVKGEWIVNLGTHSVPFVEGIKVNKNGCVL